MHHENSMPIKYKDTIKKENYLIFPMQYVLEAYNALIINTCLCVKVPSGGQTRDKNSHTKRKKNNKTISKQLH